MKELENKTHREYNEVLALLDLIPSYDYLKIPSETIVVLKRNSVKGYNVNVDNLNKFTLSKKAYAIFIKLYKQYIAEDEESEKIDDILLLNNKIEQNRYNVTFNRKEAEEKTDVKLIEIRKKPLFFRIIDKIKRIFKM